MFSVIAKISPKEEKYDYLKAILREVSTHTQKEVDCYIYTIHEATEPNSKKVFYVYESFKSKEGFDFHCQQSYMKSLFKTFETTLCKPIEVTQLQDI